MVRAVGIDPGTKSMDIFGFDDETDETIIDESIPRDKITENPGIIMEILKDLDADVIVGPSGYGIPLKRARDTEISEINMATFITENDFKKRLKIVGLRELMIMMKNSDMNIYFTPGVIQLPTIPEYRKVNKIDMGTADKLFSVVLGIKDQSESLGIEYSDVSLILIEIGFAYTAAIAVNEGKVIDGVGGTSGFPGYMGMGFMDSELAYAVSNTIEEFSKLILFCGGVADIAGINPLEKSPDEFIESEGDGIAYKAFIESIIKDLAILLPSIREPREILLSGRFTRINSFFKDIELEIRQFLNAMGINPTIRTLNRRAKNVKEGAEGAAIMANGIGNGKYSKLIENMELRNSSGTIFDHIYLGDEIKKRIIKRFC
ncbi:MAG: DUF1464 domain-containing protein [Candidatus Altiarchaeales archaeon]|nr:MAG: DUF1464 domain-containing protein [Candidatus Altiarchaeales archaeon]RLI95550.1 MAG: DUF1464 domain-containing protein [Candidatus Altiarchaeales archaeon]RLI95589.1 MAG: DUF1464 domain-containing protein [Candidatus Altiarchaeales archaeon]HDO82545.1 DUF1464 domain-containing protein [Candidatus Altiarchaeales archaeon]HEX55194.1 DUF1464 domain-containing protein [Candidatus Altiarchaeales archaeon]